MKLFVAFKDRKLKRFSLLLPDFIELYSVLVVIKKYVIPYEPLDALVHFLDEMSRWADKDLGDMLEFTRSAHYRKRHYIFLRSMRTLQDHISYIGRDKHGWNKTEAGERIAPDNVFLGNVCELPTQSVSFWKQKKYDEKGGWGIPDMEHLNSYDVVSNLSLDFLNAHIDPMVHSLSVIIEKLSSVNTK